MGLFSNLFGYDLPHDSPIQDKTESETTVTVTAPAEFVSFRSVGNYGALMSVDYVACEQTKARSMASLPFTVTVPTENGRERLGDNPLSRLLNGMANEEMTAAALMAWTVLRRDTFGNAYWYVEWRNGKPAAIWPVTCSVLHSFDRNAPIGYRTRYSVAGSDYVPTGTYFAHEIINIPTHVTKDGMKGMSLASVAAEQIGLSVDLERFYRAMLKNGNHHLGHVEVPSGRMKQEDIDSINRAIEAKQGIDNAGKAPIFGYGAKWVTDQQTMKDASVIEQQEWVLRQVCRATNVPPWKVYDSSGATYSGSQQIRIDYVTDTVMPDVRIIEKALEPVLAAMGLPNADAKFILHGLMRGDDASRSAYYRELGYLGSFTRSDIREREDMDPIPGIEPPMFPLNYGTVNPDGSVNVFSAERTPADGTQTGRTD